MVRSRVVALVAVFVVGCTLGGCSRPAARTPSGPAVASSPLAQSVTPSPTAEVAWFWTDRNPDAPLFRFVAQIHNPGPKALGGIQTEWIAYDADGSIVGSFKSERPIVPPRGTIPYVGGAGAADLSAIPAKVDMRIVQPGSFLETYSPACTVSDPQLQRESAKEYTVKARVTTGVEEVASAKLDGYIVLRDSAGAIVGADFWTPERLPERVPAGTKFILEAPFIRVTGPPKSVRVDVFEGP